MLETDFSPHWTLLFKFIKAMISKFRDVSLISPCHILYVVLIFFILANKHTIPFPAYTIETFAAPATFNCSGATSTWLQGYVCKFEVFSEHKINNNMPNDKRENAPWLHVYHNMISCSSTWANDMGVFGCFGINTQTKKCGGCLFICVAGHGKWLIRLRVSSDRNANA